MAQVMMKCGHASNAVDGDGNPACVVCFGIHPGSGTVDDAPPPLTDRVARCAYFNGKPSTGRGCDRRTCDCERPSTVDMAFFEHRPDKPFDLFYCGCFGWD